MKVLKKIPLALLGIGVGFALLLGRFLYTTKYKISDIDSARSIDGNYQVSFQAIGEPDWPFGASHARLVLKDKNGIISQSKIKVANDGGMLQPDNWHVIWQGNCVQIIISGEEQEGEIDTLYFDGTVTSERIGKKNSVQEIQKLWDITPIHTDKFHFSTQTAENKKGETVFTAFINDFISSFNRIYQQMYAEDYLPPISSWTRLLEQSPCFEYDSVHYRFSADEQTWSMPTISIYTSKNEDGIYEIKLTFDEHGDQEPLYTQFEKMCFCSLKTILPEQSNADIRDLYEKLYIQTEENFWGDYPSDDGTERPAINKIYQYDTVGLYGYYGAGTANLCVIPLTQKAIAWFKQEGVEMVEIK